MANEQHDKMSAMGGKLVRAYPSCLARLTKRRNARTNYAIWYWHMANTKEV